jgi:hypothetical protein
MYLSNSKISVVLILVFAISFSQFSVFANIFPTGLNISQKDFFSSKFSNNEKIIIMGSSHVGQLNTTHITNQLNTKKITYEVFNLSYNSDTPERRT